jgi:hypothetical protein
LKKMTIIVNYFALKCQSAGSALPSLFRGHPKTASTRQIGWIAAEIADDQMGCALKVTCDSGLRHLGRWTSSGWPDHFIRNDNETAGMAFVGTPI